MPVDQDLNASVDLDAAHELCGGDDDAGIAAVAAADAVPVDLDAAAAVVDAVKVSVGDVPSAAGGDGVSHEA